MTITSDGNVLIGTTSDAGFKLDVNGTGRFSGTITVGSGGGSTLTSGSIDVGKDIGLAATQGIVVNNARVLAFASTGAATFSGVTGTSGEVVIQKPNNASAYGSGTQMLDFKSYYPGFDVETVKASIFTGVSSQSAHSGGQRTDNGFFAVMTAASGILTERFRIESDGAATFSSSVTATAITATGLLYGNGGESNTLYTGAFFWTPGSYNFFNQKTDHSLVIGTYNANSPVAALTIVQSGAATFSSSVTATSATFSGDVAIGNTSQGRHLDLFITSPLDGKVYWGSTASPRQMFIGGDGTPRLTAQCGGSGGVQLTLGATSWSSLSDERLKNVNSNIDFAIDKLMTLNAINFSWKYDDTNKENIGLIAQEIEKVFPQVIDKSKLPSKDDEENIDETEYLSVRYTELIPVLVKAIQELNAKITQLENK
jgi:hypothetical protein